MSAKRGLIELHDTFRVNYPFTNILFEAAHREVCALSEDLSFAYGFGQDKLQPRIVGHGDIMPDFEPKFTKKIILHGCN